MKNVNYLLVFVLICSVLSCKKKSNDEAAPTTTPAGISDNYSSTGDFFSRNNVSMQSYTVNGAAGGSFTTPQGTIVTIKPNTFRTYGGALVSGDVTVKFKDIYKKSDMFLAQMTTEDVSRHPLKSGGEFYIKAIFNNEALTMVAGNSIKVAQPLALTGGADSIGMAPFVALDSMGNQLGWNNNVWLDSVSENVPSQEYLFSLYQFSPQADSGTWCNSDNSYYFNGYPQTILTLVPNNDVNTYNTYVFLLFNGVASMVHVYEGSGNFPYYYAPLGLRCTLVAVGTKNGALYSAFIPITITSNLSVPFTLSATTTDAFKAQLKALD